MFLVGYDTFSSDNLCFFPTEWFLVIVMASLWWTTSRRQCCLIWAPLSYMGLTILIGENPDPLANLDNHPEVRGEGEETLSRGVCVKADFCLYIYSLPDLIYI